MIWVIGCNGMLGSELCRQLRENKLPYLGTDKEVDITSFESLENYALDKNISFIINCAAYTAVDKAESEKDLASKLNADGPRYIARLAKKIGAGLIHISTDYVFDGTADTPRTEEMPVAPIGIYGKTKADGEKAVAEETDSFYILRTAWLYGWAGKNFVYTMIRAMNTHENVKVVCDQHGTPTFCGDLVKVIIAILNKNKTDNKVPFGVYHVTDLGQITWWDFTKEIQKIVCELNDSIHLIPADEFHLDKCTVNKCTTEEYPTPAKRPAYSVLSKDKIQKALNFQLPDWKDSLKVFLTSDFFDKERIK